MRVPVAVWQPCELLYTCYLLTCYLLLLMYLDALVGAAGEQSVSLVDGDRQHDDDGTQPDGAQHAV